MQRTIQLTADGSQTIAIPAMQVTYHSVHGAVQESRHVFIAAGLDHVLEKITGTIAIFEMGFGTGLNALLSLEKGNTEQRNIYYSAIEKFPLKEEEWKRLEYGTLLNLPKTFEALHNSRDGVNVQVNGHFTLHKIYGGLGEWTPARLFHLVFFDAFAPSAQPELWTKPIFEKMYLLLEPGGVLVTYCSKGDVRRALQAAGFSVEKLKGPPGKREMIRATKR